MRACGGLINIKFKSCGTTWGENEVFSLQKTHSVAFAVRRFSDVDGQQILVCPCQGATGSAHGTQLAGPGSIPVLSSAKCAVSMRASTSSETRLPSCLLEQ